MDAQTESRAEGTAVSGGRQGGSESSTTPKKDGVYSDGCTDERQRKNTRASGAAVKGAVPWRKVAVHQKRAKQPISIGVPDPYKQPTAGQIVPGTPPPRSGTKLRGPKPNPTRTAKTPANATIPAPKKKPTNSSTKQPSKPKEQRRAAGGPGAQAEQSRSVIEEADEDTQRRDDEEVLSQQPWRREITQVADVPANGAVS